MDMSGREKAALILVAMATALIAVSCVQTKTPPSAGITFHEAGAVGVPLAGSPPAAPPAGNNGAAVLPPAVDAAPAPSPAAAIVVHVTGAVKKPGVYHLPPGARGDDALKAAGGATGDANPDALNLAAHLEDGSQIHVPTRKEQAANSAPPAPDSYVKHESSATAKPEKSPGKATAPRSSAHSGRGGSGKLKAGDSATININTANAETLQKLPGIGPSMAERILDYRKTSGGFKSPEQLMEVSGIGPKKFEKMQPFLRVK